MMSTRCGWLGMRVATLPSTGGNQRRSAPTLDFGVALPKRTLGLVGRPSRELEVERRYAVELGPVPVLGAEGAPFGGEQRTVGALDLRYAGLDREARADHLLEVVLGLLEGRPQRAAVLDRVRHVA